MCAPPDCAERLAEVGVPLVPVGQPVRPLVHGATPPEKAARARVNQTGPPGQDPELRS